MATALYTNDYESYFPNYSDTTGERALQDKLFPYFNSREATHCPARRDACYAKYDWGWEYPTYDFNFYTIVKNHASYPTYAWVYNLKLIKRPSVLLLIGEKNNYGNEYWMPSWVRDNCPDPYDFFIHNGTGNALFADNHVDGFRRNDFMSWSYNNIGAMECPR